jgi:hypothetical protein
MSNQMHQRQPNDANDDDLPDASSPSLADLKTMCRAIREDWPMTAERRQVIVSAARAAAAHPRERHKLSAARLWRAMEEANLRQANGELWSIGNAAS